MTVIYNKEKNCLVDLYTQDCLKKNDIIQYSEGHCASKEQACNNFETQNYKLNPITKKEESRSFWYRNCRPHTTMFYDQLDNVTIKRAVAQYREDPRRYFVIDGVICGIEDWDVSRVTNMSKLFKDFYYFILY